APGAFGVGRGAAVAANASPLAVWDVWVLTAHPEPSGRGGGRAGRRGSGVRAWRAAAGAVGVVPHGRRAPRSRSGARRGRAVAGRVGRGAGAGWSRRHLQSGALAPAM